MLLGTDGNATGRGEGGVPEPDLGREGVAEVVAVKVHRRHNVELRRPRQHLSWEGAGFHGNAPGGGGGGGQGFSPGGEGNLQDGKR